MMRTTIVLCVISAALLAQNDPALESRIADLEARNREILDRLSRAEARNAALTDELREVKDAEADAAVDRMVATCVARTADNLTFKDLVRSGNRLKFYGHLALHAYYDSARLDQAVNPLFVVPENGVAAHGNDDQFAYDARLTRFGFDVDAGKIGDANVTGRLETDFSNFPAGISESRETPRIRLAYLDLDFGALGLRFGQDWDVASPLNPSVDAQNVLWNTGNLGDRRPQIQARLKEGDPKEFAWDAKLALGLGGAIDNRDLDPAVSGVSTERDGFDVGHPNVEARVGMTTASWVDGKSISAGVWGYFAGIETDTAFDGRHTFHAWATGADLSLPIAGALSFAGEIWIGSALGDIRGSMGQTITTSGPNAGDEVDAVGGWGELKLAATDALTVHAGAAIDNPSDGDVAENAANFASDGKSLNWTVYAGLIYDFGGGLKMGFDTLYRETQYAESGLGNGIRLDFWTMLTF